jgi:hypothetical protein
MPQKQMELPMLTVYVGPRFVDVELVRRVSQLPRGCACVLAPADAQAPDPAPAGRSRPACTHPMSPIT